ncbi:hypothetical protein BDV19DRAFT_388130 [Aspergillus venezuelensis]
MSHRQSCDRCRQQKVRCIRDEAQSQGHAQRGSSYPDRAPLTPCERCLKAGADCVYSLKQRSTRHAAQPSFQRPNDHSYGHTWFDQGLNATDLSKPNTTPFAALENVNPWDASLQSLLTPSTFFNPLSASSDLAPLTTQDCLAQSAARSRPESSDGLIDDYYDDDDNDNDTDNGRDTSTHLFSQLTSLSQRTRQARRRLTRPDQIPLTVSSPEVNEALESTNALIRIMNHITAPITVDTNSSRPDQGLAFLALACHQQLVALFRAICDAVRRWLQLREEEHRNRQRSNSSSSSNGSGSGGSDIGPSSVAQFIMVLQLLIHLINRMDRSLPASQDQQQHNPSLMWPAGGEISSSSTHSHYDPLLTEMIPSGPSSPGGLLVLVKEIVGTIPHEHEKLRQIIQKLQAEMEHLDFQ